MLEKHVQGLSDPTLIYEGLYDGDVDFDDDISHREQRTELELLEHISENVPSRDTLDEFVKSNTKVPKKEKVSEKALKQATEDGEPTE